MCSRIFNNACYCCYMFILLSYPLHANELYFSKIDGEDGLSENNVKAIIQDSYGFIWFGTRNGLNRYDGKQIKTFDIHDLTTGRNDRNIGALLEDDSKQLWIGTDKGIFIYNPIKERFKFLNHQTRNGGYLDNWVSDIKKDLDGNIWIIIPGQGVFKYVPSRNRIFEYRISEQQDSKKSPQSIHISKTNQVWIGSNGIGIFELDRKSNKFKQHLIDKFGNSLLDKNIYTICEYNDKLVLGVHEGKLLHWDIKNNILSEFNLPDVHYKIIRKVESYDNENLFIGTEIGLFVYNEHNKLLRHYQEDGLNPYSLSDNAIYSIYKDNEGGMWIGTLLGGANYVANRNIEFEKYVPLNSPNSLSTKKIRELCEDNDGNIWIGTENGGINIFNPKTKTFKVLNIPKKKSTNLALMLNNNRMFIGNFKREMDIVDLSNKSIRHFTREELGIDEESVCAMLIDSRGQHWLGNANEVNLSIMGNLKFQPRRDIASGYVYDIQEDNDGNIWISTLGNGVYKYDPKIQKSKQYLYEDSNPNSLSSNTVSSITIAPNGVIWFSTDRGGICRYNKDLDNFTTYSIKDGLPDNVAYKILIDKESNLWFGTNKGLVRFNPKSKSVRVFTQSDGLLGNQFSYKSALISRSGKFYFGGTNGLISFNPNYTLQNKNAPPVYITRLYIHNKEVNITDEVSPLEQSLQHTKTIKLNYTQSNISLDFAALSYTAPATNLYAYKMDGIDKDWVYTHSQSASYSQMRPGQYMFHVKAANGDGIWNKTGTNLQIIISPPWWESSLAYLVYSLIVSLILYYILHYYNKKKEQKNIQALKLFEIKKEHELYRSKLDFFTTIAHEIKTPLSLIKAPLEEVNKMAIEDSFVRKSLHVMELNTNRLLNLINQLLDFRKIDSSSITLYYTRENIGNLLQETLTRFEPAIFSSNKTISFKMPQEELYAPIDKEEVTKIISNLLNNALKYCSHTIKVILLKENTSFSIQVISDGKIIPENQREKIFEPFYQIKNENEISSGVGIGLSMARYLAQLHGGILHLSIMDNIWNCFTLTLPLYQANVITLEHPQDKDIEDLVPETKTLPADGAEYSILIVDDNIEILQLLSDRLASQFIIHTALDGQEAITKLKENNIHLVISDVMMPVMNGLALCSYIKNELEFSHIPVILLTAKNDMDSKIKGLETGADAYLEKPFSLSFLAAQVSNLLENRKKEREAFAKRPFFPVYNLKMNKADEEFMNKTLERIKENIADENFNVERLAELLNMSRSALHKKIKSMVDMAPVDFIRIVRLKKAAELIQDGKYNMAEISVMVGINSPSYFSKLFFKQFGVTPKNFSRKQKE